MLLRAWSANQISPPSCPLSKPLRRMLAMHAWCEPWNSSRSDAVRFAGRGQWHPAEDVPPARAGEGQRKRVSQVRAALGGVGSVVLGVLMMGACMQRSVL